MKAASVMMHQLQFKRIQYIYMFKDKLREFEKISQESECSYVKGKYAVC